MSRGNVDVAREAYAAFNRGDLEGVLDCIDPKIEWHMSEQFARGGRVFRGHEGVKRVFETFRENFDDFRNEPQEFIVAGDHVVVPVILRGRQKGGGAEVAFEIVQVWTARNGKALRMVAYGTKDQAFDAIGFDPSGARVEGA